jgi:hypothetical protein
MGLLLLPQPQPRVLLLTPAAVGGAPLYHRQQQLLLALQRRCCRLLSVVRLLPRVAVWLLLLLRHSRP